MRRKIFGFLSISLIFICCNIFALPSIAANSKGLEATPAEYSIAKNFSENFCSAMNDGLNQESAWNYSSRQVFKILLMPTFWKKAFSSEEENFDWGSNAIVSISSTKIINDCGGKLDLDGQDGIQIMRNYLHSKFNQFEGEPDDEYLKYKSDSNAI